MADNFGQMVDRIRQLRDSVARLRDTASNVMETLDDLLGTGPAPEPTAAPVSARVLKKVAEKKVDRHPDRPLFKDFVYPVLASQPSSLFTVKQVFEAIVGLGWKGEARSSLQYLNATLNKHAKNGILTKVETDTGRGRPSVRFGLAAQPSVAEARKVQETLTD
jgi:hypothetical protein